MKTIASGLSVLALLILFFGCSKEKSLENGKFLPIDSSSDWRFQDSAALYQGKVDSAYTDTQGTLEALTIEGTSNDVTGRFFLQVISDPLLPGDYTGENVNFGYFLNGTLYYTNSKTGGDFTVTITHLDSATVSGTFKGLVTDVSGNFVTVFEGSFSTKLHSANSFDPAEGTIDCSSVTVQGAYNVDQSLDQTNTIQLTVDVTKPGRVTFQTATVNGIFFAGDETFTDIGTATVTLFGIGTPSQGGTADFTIAFGQSTCHATVNIEGTAEPVQPGQPGTLLAEDKIQNPAITDSLKYNSSNLIAQIQSTGNPLRKVKYGAQGIDLVEFWLPDGTGGFLKGATLKYFYDGNSNITAITTIDGSGNTIDSVQQYTYNADKTIATKNTYSSGSLAATYRYEYSGGNMTKVFTHDATGSRADDVLTFTYDTRQNNFPTIQSQYYFLDMATVFDLSGIFDSFYFSANYPTQVTSANSGVAAINVEINPNMKPIKVSLNNLLYYKYTYNN